MATAKKNNYISAELDFAEEQLAHWRTYIEENPFHEIEDRWGVKETAKGGAVKVVVATKEQQMTSVRATMKEYLQMLEIVNRLRREEEERKSARGGHDIPLRMQ